MKRNQQLGDKKMVARRLKETSSPVIKKWQFFPLKNSLHRSKMAGPSHALKALSFDPFKQPISYSELFFFGSSQTTSHALKTRIDIPKWQPLISSKNVSLLFSKKNPLYWSLPKKSSLTLSKPSSDASCQSPNGAAGPSESSQVTLWSLSYDNKLSVMPPKSPLPRCSFFFFLL